MLNFNDAPAQSTGTGSAFPPDSIIAFKMTIRPPKAGKEGSQSQWYTKAASGNEFLDCEFEPAGKFEGRKIWEMFTMTGMNKKNQPNANQSMGTLRAIIESARNVRADDASPQAAAGRQLSDWADFNGMVFLAKVKCVVEQSSKDGNHYVNNAIAKIITPDMPEYAAGEHISDKPLPQIPDPSTKPAGPGVPAGAPGGLPAFGAPQTAKPAAAPAGPGGFGGGFGAQPAQTPAQQPTQPAAPMTGGVPGWAAK